MLKKLRGALLDRLVRPLKENLLSPLHQKLIHPLLEKLDFGLRHVGLLTPPPPTLQARKNEVDTKRFNEALLATAVGMTAGFVASGLTIAVAKFVTAEPFKGLWNAGIALLLGSSTFIRVLSHFALRRPIDYDKYFLYYDVILVGAASIALGAIEAHQFPNLLFWIASAVVGAALFARRARLSGKHGYQLPWGQWFLVVGIVWAVGIAIRAPKSVDAARWLLVFVVLAVAYQLYAELRGSFPQINPVAYRDYWIEPTPKQLDTGKWALEIQIARDIAPRRVQGFAAAGTFNTWDQAIAGCFQFGRDVIDGKIPNCSVTF